MFTYAPKAAPSPWMATVIVATMLVGPARAEEGVPNFSPDNRTGWIAGDPNGPIPIGDDYLPQPPGAGPGAVVSDKDHPYIDNRVARLTGKQPNNRVADVSNPILQPWARESLRKLNARAFSEPVFPTPKERCWPIGVPGWLLYPVTPVYSYCVTKFFAWLAGICGRSKGIAVGRGRARRLADDAWWRLSWGRGAAA
jgi:hypothetical protein